MCRPVQAMLALSVLLVVACAQWQLPQNETASPPPLTDVELFAKGIDQLASGVKPESFVRLARDYPASPWLTRARTVETLAGKLQEAEREGLRLAKGQAACEEERARLQTDVRSLEEYTGKLKALLSESGITGPALPLR